MESQGLPPQRFTAVGFLRLALPMIISRAGLAAMSIADGIMVSRYQPKSFACLSLADGTLGRILDIFIAFLIGGLSLVPRYVGQGDANGARKIWLRTIPVSIALGLVGVAIGFAGHPLLWALGQKPEIAGAAASVMGVLGVGYPSALLALSAAVYLEGINRPQAVAISVVAANVLNVLLNWVLIGGHSRIPALGAVGSALSTTMVRCGLAIVLTTLAWRSAAPASAAVAQTGAGDTLGDTIGDTAGDTAGEPEDSSPSQWKLGFGAASSTAVMVCLGSSLIIFAGWLGVFPLATFSAVWSLAAPAMLISLGMADAAGINVAAAAGRDGESGAASVAWPSLRITFAVLAVIAIGLTLFAKPLSQIYTDEPGMRASMTAVVPLAALVILTDCVGFVMSASLRGIKDIAWPASIDISAMVILVPLAATLAFVRGFGVRGLFLAMFAAGLMRTAMLTGRFIWCTRAVGGRAAAQLEVGV